MIIDQLTLWQRLTWIAHLWKACAKQHHKALGPYFARYLPDDGVVFDVGAHSGQFSKLFAGLVPRGRVYSFEPGSYALSILVKAIKFNGKRNVTIEPIGLGSEAGSYTLTLPLKKSGSLGFGLGFVGEAGQESRQIVNENIRVRELDEFVAERNIQRVDFIKADIEGYELEMLRGARMVLERDQPAVYIEVDEARLKRAGGSAEEIFQLMAAVGYYCADLASGDALPKGHMKEGDLFFLAYDKAYSTDPLGPKD